MAKSTQNIYAARRPGANSQADSEAVTAAVAADRARRAAVLALSETSGREGLARHLLDNTSETVATIRGILSTSPMALPEPANVYARRAAANPGLDSLQQAAQSWPAQAGVQIKAEASRARDSIASDRQPAYNPHAGETEAEAIAHLTASLPAQSAQKFEKTEELKEDAGAVNLGGYEREQNLSRLISTKADKLRQAGTDVERVRIKADIDALEVKLAEMRKANAPKFDEWNARAHQSDRIIKRLSRFSFEICDAATRNYLAAEHPPVQHQLQDQGNIFDHLGLRIDILRPDAKLPKLTEARALLDSIRAEVKKTRDLPVDRAEAIESIVKRVHQMAEFGSVDILRTVEDRDAIHFKHLPMEATNGARKLHADHRDAALAIAAWMDPESLIRKMTAEITATLPETGITMAERNRRLAALLQAEARAEYVEVWAHDAEIGDYLYRDSIRVEAMLGIEIINIGA